MYFSCQILAWPGTEQAVLDLISNWRCGSWDHVSDHLRCWGGSLAPVAYRLASTIIKLVMPGKASVKPTKALARYIVNFIVMKFPLSEVEWRVRIKLRLD
jgi:hypothetical protein